MFGRTIIIDGKEVFVFCSPSDPYSEVLRRAANTFERDEMKASKGWHLSADYDHQLETVAREMKEPQ